MDTALISRWQFGFTTLYHYIFVPITIGLVYLVAIMNTKWYRTGDVMYLRMTKFFGKLFLINFAVGVVTGIVQEFQFGMNWSNYSRFVGDIFGAPLAFEGLMAFFLESTFIGLWLFGWGKLSPKLHLACIWLVALGTTISAYWIIAANAWMQHPVGYRLNPETQRAELTSFLDFFTNSTAIYAFAHAMAGAAMVGGFLVISVAAWHIARNRDTELFGKAMRMGLAVGIVPSIFVAMTGHGQAQLMTEQQPMKMAAAEALWESEGSAGFSLFAIGDVGNGRNHFNVTVPNALSVLATNTFDGRVEGINEVQRQSEAQFGPGRYIPIVWVNYWSFRLMIGFGLLGLAICALTLVQMRRGSLYQNKTLMKILPWIVVLPILGNLTGWIFTEIGRQPWIVYGLLRTEDAVSPGVTAGEALFSLVIFASMYGALSALNIWMLRKHAIAGPTNERTPQEVADALVY